MIPFIKRKLKLQGIECWPNVTHAGSGSVRCAPPTPDLTGLMCPCGPSNPSTIQGTRHHHWPHSSHYLCPVYKPSALGALDGQNPSCQTSGMGRPCSCVGRGPARPQSFPGRGSSSFHQGTMATRTRQGLGGPGEGEGRRTADWTVSVGGEG